MSLSFPLSPTVGQTYTSNSNTWTWDGAAWTIKQNTAVSFSSVVASTLSGSLTGNVVGNLTGNVTGNLTGNVTGNATTVTNGLYTTGTYSNPSWLTGISGGIVSGAISGSAAKLTTPVQINGVNFDGSSAITVPANANTLTGTTLANNITSSSLTSIGALTSLTSGTVNINGSITASSTTGALSYGTLTYPDTNIFANFTTNVNSYAQIILENTSTGNAASTDFIVSNNIGTAASYYGDFGINGSGFTGTGSLGLANAVYLYSANSDLTIGTLSSSPIHFVVNNSTTDAMTINANGSITASGNVTVSGTGFFMGGGLSPTGPSLSVNNIGESLTLTTAAANAGSINFYLGVNSIYYYTSTPTSAGAFTLNISGTVLVTLNSMMSTAQSISIALFVTNGAYATYPNIINIDGTAQTVKWANGVLISAGNTYATDVYNFTIIKTANATFTVLGSQVKYA